LVRLLAPNALVVVNANDVLPTTADSTLGLVPNTDLYYLTGIEQEQSLLLLYPDADDEKLREILFLREPTAELRTWEGHKLTVEDARRISGIRNVQWLQEFPRLFHRLMCECEHVYLDSNEHKRAVIEVETREARFVAETRRRYPLHDYRRLARLMHRLRVVKAPREVERLREACAITGRAFERVLRFLRPGRFEYEVQAEFAHEFVRNRCRFAYEPIIASGANAVVLHYNANAAPCRDGELLLLDVGACARNYNADMTRTIPVNGRFTRRQRRVYEAVLRVMRGAIRALRPGLLIKDWQKQAEQAMEAELVDLGLVSMREIRRQDPDRPAFKKYFMHGLGHPLGLDVHDLGVVTEPMQEGWVMTVEPGIYIPEENLGVRLENDVLITADGPVDLMESIPIEPDAIEAAMRRREA
jgi:Xaa-Pro aminopeptidase